ncbi:hypothetical protein [Costertonia aggregata]|uniref:Uncharacterized protein n=1 Tax=Costertonia aggregata TaxID=343403 RepID=A0A7H9ALU9_9FLAO|nr:hypothetical protein [Costertonia aggregata]QLG44419.1 hypothetical protein HYG79_03345 [Costertonia aggregata]
MAPIKFEEHIKDKLQEREIKPSLSAWERISEKLETPVKQKRSSFFWYGIAAGFIGLLLVSILFFKSKNPLKIKNDKVIVNTEQKGEKQEDDKKALPVLEGKSGDKYAEAPKSIKYVEKETIAPQLDRREENLAGNAQRGIIEDKVQKVFDTPEKIIEKKLVEVLAQANSMEQNNETLTDAEVDSLLRQAQKEILTNKLFRDTNKVDAMALLSDVESEIDQSFRDQIFEKLKTGFFKVRTAVADRNN